MVPNKNSREKLSEQTRLSRAGLSVSLTNPVVLKDSYFNEYYELTVDEFNVFALLDQGRGRLAEEKYSSASIKSFAKSLKKKHLLLSSANFYSEHLARHPKNSSYFKDELLVQDVSAKVLQLAKDLQSPFPKKQISEVSQACSSYLTQGKLVEGLSILEMIRSYNPDCHELLELEITLKNLITKYLGEKHSQGKSKNNFSVLFSSGRLANPSAFLKTVHQLFSPLYSSYALILYLLTISLGLINLVGSGSAVDISNLNADNPVWWLMAPIVVLFLLFFHEMAHCMTCMRFGGTVREIGWVFYLFKPGIYCDVSDSLLFPKWKRLLVVAAGPINDLFWASIAIIAYILFAEQSEFLRFVLTFVLTYLTVVVIFNLLPILKFDGYYLLNDILSCVDLKRDSREATRNIWKRRFHPTGIREVVLLLYFCFHFLVLWILFPLMLLYAIYKCLFLTPGIADFFLLAIFLYILSAYVMQVLIRRRRSSGCKKETVKDF